ncbi:UNVERIFIED_ORG: hypothetical protein J2W65_002677 [Pseudomonas parafulva]|jgi:hypothetical protein|uniref:hypothetical protein n=1 Tax=Pseudomonas TaxID=286 RepID=UPI0024483164|nr:MULTISPECIES: hypothetical protein [Pseudomonas]MDH0617472.1 hypothetical protein [Pseudomonas fulva]MDH1305303.1 hypothetical protein [Pseudomonas fulva]MDP9557036.1 hypothetical protein [Pseudomonas parafulva]
MTTKAPHFEFDPSLRIFGAADDLWVVFDSQSPNDALRATRSVRLPRVFEQLSLLVEGFDSVDDDGHRRIIPGTTSLEIRFVDGSVQVHELAQLQLVFHAEADRKGALNHIDPALVGYNVRQALSERLNEALIDHFQQGAAPVLPADMSAMAALPVGAAHYSTAAPLPSRQALREQASSEARRQERSRRRKTLLAWVVPPVLVIGVLATLSHLASTQSPIENAVAQHMANDPESIKAQVELTKQTLQSMGLDPGQGGDLGCLAPQ